MRSVVLRNKELAYTATITPYGCPYTNELRISKIKGVKRKK
jgi:hypothetical protein